MVSFAFKVFRQNLTTTVLDYLTNIKLYSDYKMLIRENTMKELIFEYKTVSKIRIFTNSINCE